MSVIFNRLLSLPPDVKKNSGIIFQESHYSYERFITNIQDAIRALESEKAPSRFVFWYGKDYYSLLCLFFACMQTKRFLLPGISMRRLVETSEHVPVGTVFENYRRTDIETLLPTDNLSDFTEGGLLLSTSGTTTGPRWALLSEKMLSSNVSAAIELQQLRPQDRILAFSGLHHTGGWNINLLPGLLAGSEIQLIGRFSPYQSLKLIQNQISVKTHLSPPQINLWQNLKSWKNANLSSLQTLVTGSSEVWPHTVSQLLKKGVKQVLRNYGLTEGGPMIFCETVSSANDDMETYGTLSKGIKILSDNEHRLLVQGDALFSGYMREGLLTKPPGIWWDTGDLFIKKRHRFHFAGRANDRIFIDQLLLYPSLIEGKILQELPGLRECALVRPLGAPYLCLFYSTAQLLDESQVQQAAERAAGVKVQVIRCKHLPRNSSGKIDRGILRSSPPEQKRSNFSAHI